MNPLLTSTLWLIGQLITLIGAAVAGWMLRGVVERLIEAQAQGLLRSRRPTALDRYAARARRPIRVRHHAVR